MLSHIASLAGVPWFVHVGEPYTKPQWATRMTLLASWAAARAAARAAAEIMGGKHPYFSLMMRVYRDGHWPIAFDGKHLIVF